MSSKGAVRAYLVTMSTHFTFPNCDPSSVSMPGSFSEPLRSATQPDRSTQPAAPAAAATSRFAFLRQPPAKHVGPMFSALACSQMCASMNQPESPP
jgi:hypothetical protein